MGFLRKNLWILPVILSILSACLSAMTAQNAKKSADEGGSCVARKVA